MLISALLFLTRGCVTTCHNRNMKTKALLLPSLASASLLLSPSSMMAAPKPRAAVPNPQVEYGLVQFDSYSLTVSLPDRPEYKKVSGTKPHGASCLSGQRLRLKRSRD
jgi:hypothetical protein